MSQILQIFATKAAANPGHEKSGEFPRLSVLSFGVMLSFVAWINNPPSVQRHFVVLLKRHNYDAYAVGLGGDHYFGIVYDSIKIFFYVFLINFFIIFT